MSQNFQKNSKIHQNIKNNVEFNKLRKFNSEKVNEGASRLSNEDNDMIIEDEEVENKIGVVYKNNYDSG